MANMSYCRFENTSHDLRDCINAVEDAQAEGTSFDTFVKKLSSREEREAFHELFSKCEDFVQVYLELKDAAAVDNSGEIAEAEEE